MYRYQVIFSHPTLDPDEVGEFLEWDLNAEELEIERPEVGEGRVVARFRHSFVEPTTVASRLWMEFAVEAEVERTAEATPGGPAGSAAAPAAPVFQGEASLRTALTRDGLLDRRALVEGRGLEEVRAVDRALGALLDGGEIEAVSRQLYRAKTAAARPDPEAQAVARRARALEAHEIILLEALKDGEALGPALLLGATGLTQGRLMSAASSLEERGLLATSGQGTRWLARLTDLGRDLAAQEGTG